MNSIMIILIKAWSMGKCNLHNILLLNSYMDTIRELFQDAISDFHRNYNLELSKNLIKWKVNYNDNEIKLQVSEKNNFNNKWDLIAREVKSLKWIVQRYLKLSHLMKVISSY
jgi:hypothetical protein